MPDSYGVGVAWSTDEGRAKVALDYDRVQYSQLTDGLLNLLARETADFDPGDYRVADGNELHVGFEAILGSGSQLIATVRLGAWYDPAHTLVYDGADPVLRTRFLPGEDALHGSIGAGFVIRENLQIDAAVDLSDRFTTASVSMVKFF